MAQASFIQNSMTNSAPPARMHLLPAKTAPYVIVLRRKPTRWWHVMRWNTQTDQVEHGSWFFGTLYPKRADVSFDGNWLTMLAMEPGCNVWNRISRAPCLDPTIEVDAEVFYGGGYWECDSLLRLNGWYSHRECAIREMDQTELPFELRDACADVLGDVGVLYPRLRRDGWIRCGENWGVDTTLVGGEIASLCVGDDGWKNQPTPSHPTLRMTRVGHKNGTDQFHFWLEEFPTLIPDSADWACWDCLGQLALSCHGVLYKYGLNEIEAGTPKTVLDFEHLTPPPLVAILIHAGVLPWLHRGTD